MQIEIHYEHEEEEIPILPIITSQCKRCKCNDSLILMDYNIKVRRDGYDFGIAKSKCLKCNDVRMQSIKWRTEID